MMSYGFDTPPAPNGLPVGLLVLDQGQSTWEADATSLLLQALLMVAQEEPYMVLPYVLRPVCGWQIVQCGVQ